MDEPTQSHDSQASVSLRRPRWRWPPRPFTVVVVACVLVVALFANFPAVEAPHAGLKDGTFGLHFNLVRQYEHGWPARYARRETPLVMSSNPLPSVWRPWEGPGRWSIVNLLFDLGLWSLIVVAAGIAAQYWRAQRRAIWQLGLRDLLVLTALAGVGFAWLADQRAEYFREQALVETRRMRPGNAVTDHEFGACVPMALPESWQARYREHFNRPYYFYSSGDTDLACQHRHVIGLREINFHPDFPDHLRQMSGLEAIDVSLVKFPYFDVTRQATILRDLTPLPNLRGINLLATNATDADMAWLAACRRLEVIDLSNTDIGDHGLAHLAGLPRLRSLEISSDRISDRGCKSIADIRSLEELSLASRNVHDAGVRELSRLQNLRVLKLTATASETAFADLRRQVPKCDIKAKSY